MRVVMRKDLEGEVSIAGESFAIVVSRYNEMVTRRLLNGATGNVQTARRAG